MTRSCSALGVCAFPNCDCPAAPVRMGSLDDALKYAEFLEAERDRLATALSLAQTEIKGHMRIEDDLKRDLGLERESHEVTKRMLSDRDGRIAELEKLLQEIMACPRSDPNRGKGRWFSVMAKTGLIERIGEALKSRA